MRMTYACVSGWVDGCIQYVCKRWQREIEEQKQKQISLLGGQITKPLTLELTRCPTRILCNVNVFKLSSFNPTNAWISSGHCVLDVDGFSPLQSQNHSNISTSCCHGESPGWTQCKSYPTAIWHRKFQRGIFDSLREGDARKSATKRWWHRHVASTLYSKGPPKHETPYLNGMIIQVELSRVRSPQPSIHGHGRARDSHAASRVFAFEPPLFAGATHG